MKLARYDAILVPMVPFLCYCYRWLVSWFGLIHTSAVSRGSGAFPRMASLSFSAIIIVGLLVLPLVTVGMIDASTMRSPSKP